MSSPIKNERISNSNIKTKLSSHQCENILLILKQRFEKNMNRPEHLSNRIIQSKLRKSPEKLWSLNEMELTGGEPDVIAHNEITDEYIFYDCSAESPPGRRNI